jgi:ribonucleoside-diphosphate reductase alpha chain
VLDYLFRRMALDYLPYEKRAQLGIFTAEERAAQVANDYGSSSSNQEELDLEAMRSTVDYNTAGHRTERIEASGSHDEDGEAMPHNSTELMELRLGKAADAPLCMTCGTKMRPAGSCYVCEGCGSTSGCS